MSGVAEEAAVPGYLNFVVCPDWQGKLRLVTSGNWITLAELQAIEHAAEAEGITAFRLSLMEAGGQPETLAQARAVLQQMAGEREAVDAQLEKARQSLRKAAEALGTASAHMNSLREHDRRATSALSDVLATFLPDDKGWTRSVSVTIEDFAGWQGAAQPWEGTSAS